MNPMKHIFLLLAILFGLHFGSRGEALSQYVESLPKAQVLSASDLARDENVLRVTGIRGYALYKSAWRYSSSDDVRFAAADYNDSLWKVLPYAVFRADTMPEGFWRGIGWFRLRLRAASPLHRRTVMLLMPSFGAREIYCNGTLIEAQGKPAPSADEEQLPGYARSYMHAVPLMLDSAREYVLAVRYSCHKYEDYERLFFGLQPTPPLGMQMVITSEDSWHQYERTALFVLLEFGAYCIAPTLACMVHLMFFVLYPSEKSNLPLALCNGMLAMTAFSGLTISHYYGQSLPMFFAANLLLRSSVSFALLGFVYALYHLFFTPPFPRSRYLMLVLTAGAQVFALRPLFLDVHSAASSQQGFLVLPFLFSIYVVSVVVIKRPKGSWILGVGIVIVLITGAAEIVLELRGVVFAARPPVVSLGIRMGIFLSMPIALMLSMGQRVASQAHELSRQNEILEEQVQRRTLELQQANEEVHRQISILDEQSHIIEYANTELQERNTALDLVNKLKLRNSL